MRESDTEGNRQEPEQGREVGSKAKIVGLSLQQLGEFPSKKPKMCHYLKCQWDPSKVPLLVKVSGFLEKLKKNTIKI